MYPSVRRLSRVPVVHRFPDADPDVDQADPCDQAAHEVLLQEPSKLRVVCEQSILRPDPHPGKDREQHAHFYIKDNLDYESDAVDPDGDWRGRRL